MWAHENLINDKKILFRSSLKNNHIDFKFANKFESLKLSILNRIKKNFQNIQNYQNENNGNFDQNKILEIQNLSIPAETVIQRDERLSFNFKFDYLINEDDLFKNIH